MDSEAETQAICALSDDECAAFDWLSERGTTLWAHHEIQSIEGRIAAAKWFAKEVNAMMDWQSAWMPKGNNPYDERIKAEIEGFNTDRWDVT